MESFFSRRETRQWVVVISLLVCMILVAGPTYGVYGVFFNPLLKAFNLSRAQVSSLSGALFLALGLSAPLIGWLLDRIEAKLVLVAGTLVIVAAFVLASRAHSLGALLIAHLLMGAGVSARLQRYYSVRNRQLVRRAQRYGAGRRVCRPRGRTDEHDDSGQSPAFRGRMA